MLILNVMCPISPRDRAAQLFYARHGIATRTEVRTGPRSVAWRIMADLGRTGQIPDRIVAGGVADTRAQADRQIARRFQLWTILGPAGMVGRASW